MGYSKTFFIPEAKGLTTQGLCNQFLVFSLIFFSWGTNRCISSSAYALSRGTRVWIFKQDVHDVCPKCNTP